MAVNVVVDEGLKVRGRFNIKIHNEDGSLADERTVDNIMCTAGYIILVQAMAWSMAIDQNQTLGILLTPQYAAPVFGAVGSSTGNPSAADTQLYAELGRSTLYSVSTNSTSITLGFFFGTSVSTWTITEAGIFVSGTTTVNSGSLLDHALVSPPVSKSAAQTATLSIVLTFS